LQGQGPSTRLLLGKALRIPIEHGVSSFLGRKWRVTEAHDRTNEASHPAAILSDGIYAVFVKVVDNPRAWDELTTEMNGLRLLTERTGVLTPAAIGLKRIGEQVLLILEAVEMVERQEHHWREIGQALARLHQAKSDRFGLQTHSYWGSLVLDNTQHADWVEFYRSRRLQPRLKAAIDSGNLPREFVSPIERVSARLEELCGPAVEPSLLHGDAHYNNILTTAKGPVFIDPAVYYGHPEVELAYIDLFELAFAPYFPPVPEAFFQGYREVRPIDDGFSQRRDLWRIPAWLALVELDGPRHIPSLQKALQRYQ
jgi:protein-ribulosamine 3-kinase